MENSEESSQLNPYAPPQASECAVAADVASYPPASDGKRFLNYIIDNAAVLGVGLVLGIILAVSDEAGITNDAIAVLENLSDAVLGLSLTIMYYVSVEGLTGRTLGKLITGTKVIDIYTERKPGLGKLLGRTLARFIPFEPFSFLGSRPGGWHDRMSGTMVVDIRKPIDQRSGRPRRPYFK